MENNKSCCPSGSKKGQGFWQGLFYGLLPHSFCFGFIVFSIIGVTVASTFFRKVLLLTWFFPALVGLSLVFASISAVIYLKRNESLSKAGILKKWRYLAVLYATTVGINLLLFLVIFPLVTNLNLGQPKPAVLSQESKLSTTILKVAIPCPGHAPLIIEELEKVEGVVGVTFSFPNLFEVSFEPTKITPQKILNLEIFKTFKASIS